MLSHSLSATPIRMGFTAHPWLLAGLLLGCADKGTDAAPAVDVLLVIDNSESMPEENSLILAHLSELITPLGDHARVGITTTTSISGWTGPSSQADPGEAGRLVGPVRTSSDPQIIAQLQQDIACRSTCWNGAAVKAGGAQSAEETACDIAATGVTQASLSCTCADIDYPWDETLAGTWDSQLLCGGELETPMESALLALCRAAEDPPDVCWNHTAAMLDPDEATHSTPDFLRADTPTAIIILTDEGDASPMYGTQSDSAGAYIQAFERFGHPIQINAIGPELHCEGGTCSLPCADPQTQVMEVSRIKNATEDSGGRYLSLTDSGSDCATSQLTESLRAIGEHIITD